MSSTLSMAIDSHFCTCFGYKNGFVLHTHCFILFSPNNVLWRSIPVNHNKTVIHCFKGCMLLHGANAPKFIPQFHFGTLTMFNSIIPSYNSTGLLWACNSELDKGWWLETHSSWVAYGRPRGHGWWTWVYTEPFDTKKCDSKNHQQHGFVDHNE